jgi:hypothetical protein
LQADRLAFLDCVASKTRLTSHDDGSHSAWGKAFRTEVYNYQYEVNEQQRDRQLEKSLQQVTFQGFDDSVILPPGSVMTVSPPTPLRLSAALKSSPLTVPQRTALTSVIS